MLRTKLHRPPVTREHIWVDNPNDARKVRWIFNEEIRSRFNEARIEFPYPHMVIRDADYSNKPTPPEK